MIEAAPPTTSDRRYPLDRLVFPPDVSSRAARAWSFAVTDGTLYRLNGTKRTVQPNTTITREWEHGALPRECRRVPWGHARAPCVSRLPRGRRRFLAKSPRRYDAAPNSHHPRRPSPHHLRSRRRRGFSGAALARTPETLCRSLPDVAGPAARAVPEVPPSDQARKPRPNSAISAVGHWGGHRRWRR
ncbi:hypothetical protein J2S53_003726 [Actinopolyspora lacussalsi]|nr:hypothetical protein [Actinopolyspora lacussalsi]